MMNNIEQFDLQEYLDNPNRKVVTRAGKDVRIVCIDENLDDHPIVALLQGKFCENTYFYRRDGLWLNDIETSMDLFFATEKEERKNKHQGWINIYKHDTGNIRYPNFVIYNTEEEAKKERGSKCVATIKIEWEE